MSSIETLVICSSAKVQKYTESFMKYLPFMEANYTQNMTLDEFATYTGRSLATFKRDFAKVSDVSPEKWLIRKRLDKVYELLAAGHLKPSEVYVAVGFKNRSHFFNAFKRQFGVSPGGVAVRS